MTRWVSDETLKLHEKGDVAKKKYLLTKTHQAKGSRKKQYATES